VQDLVENDPDILYVEADSLVRPLGEVVPYGIDIINARGLYPPAASSSTTGSPCSDPSSFKIGIVDSGLDVNHPDIPCFNTDDPSIASCIGTSFGLASGWSSPTDNHGTFVTGIISAIRGNGGGVTGVLNNQNVCIMMARVFGSSVPEALLSNVLEGVQWVVDQGANVINLSLGGPEYSQTAENLYQSIRDDNRLVFCASGNDGTSDLLYPASFPSTISVGAVDESLNLASFSQFNSEVDLVAPGVGILSTSPLGLGYYMYQVEAGSQTYLALLLSGSPKPTSELSGTLENCPNQVQDVCTGSSGGGHICLIERYVAQLL
jgi:subtilisin family serine protease